MHILLNFFTHIQYVVCIRMKGTICRFRSAQGVDKFFLQKILRMVKLANGWPDSRATESKIHLRGKSGLQGNKAPDNVWLGKPKGKYRRKLPPFYMEGKVEKAR